MKITISFNIPEISITRKELTKRINEDIRNMIQNILAMYPMPIGIIFSEDIDAVQKPPITSTQVANFVWTD